MISKATQSDIAALNILVNSAFRGESSKKGWTTEADLLDGIRTDENILAENLNQPKTTILKYTEADEILGMVMLKNQGESLYLGMLTVAPDLQGSGIGKKLLYASEVFAKEQGVSKIEMTVISIRTELVAWYERHGYTRTGEVRPFPMDDPKFGLPKAFLEFVVMEKEISILHRLKD
jgi:ribosomal protein S18 acetylase RimI-like enzyme